MSILLADIDATCAALGYSDGQKYQAEPDAIQGLKHLIWILRRDLDNHEYRRHLGHSKVLQTDLVYMLPDYIEDNDLADVLIRLLVILTNPTLLLYRDGPPKDNHGRKVFLELIDILQSYKGAFTRDAIWAALFGKLQKSLEIDWALRSEEQSLLIERILVLIRNVLQVPANPEAECRADSDASLHDQVIWALHQSGILDLVLFIISSPDEHQFHLHCLEILCLLYREQTAESLADASLQRSVSEKQRDEQELVAARRRERQRMLTKPPPGRHSRFGGTYVIRNMKSVSDRDIICHQPLERVVAMDFDREKAQKRRPHRHIQEEATAARRSAFSVRLCLREYCIEVLRSAYNTLVRQVRRVLERNAGSTSHDDSYLLWAIRFFMEFNRLCGLQLHLVSESLSVQCFHWVLTCIQHNMDMIVSDKKQARAWAKRLHVALITFRELLLSMLGLQKLQDDNARALFDMLLNNVCYVLEYRETILHLLMNYNEAHSTKVYLRDVVETVNIFTKMMERFCKGSVVVQDKRRTKKRPKNLQNNHPTRTPEELENELENNWASLSTELVSLLSNEMQMPEEDQPLPFDATLEKDIDDQREDCMLRIHKFLRDGDLMRAVALMRSAREVWPENDVFGAMSAAPEDELLLLREIYFHNITTDSTRGDQQQNTLEVPDEEDEDIDEYGDDEDEETVEKAFKFDDFVKRLLNPKIVRACTVVLTDWEQIPTKSLKASVTILHRIAYGCSCPAMLYQAKLFRIFQQVLCAPRDQHHEELRRLGIFIVRKFVEAAPKNPKIYAELLFYKSIKEANELESGYCDMYESGPKGHWTEEQEMELRLLFEENQRNPHTDQDVIDWILDNLIEKTRTRRGVLKKLREMGLKFKAPTKKSTASAANKNLWQQEEDEELRSLYDQYRMEEDCLNRILTEFGERRNKQQIIKRMLQLYLIADKSEILPKKTKSRKSKKNQSRSRSDEDSDQEMPLEDVDERTHANKDGIARPKTKQMTQSKKPSKRPKRKVVRTSLDIATVRALICNVDEEKWAGAVEWLKECLHEAAEETDEPLEEEDGIPIVPLSDAQRDAMENPDFQKVLVAIGIQPPVAGEETYWRIPTYLNSADLKLRAQVVAGEEVTLNVNDGDGDEESDKDQNSNCENSSADEESEPDFLEDRMKRQRDKLNSLMFSKSDDEDKERAPLKKEKKQKQRQRKVKDRKPKAAVAESEDEEQEVQEIERKLQKKRHFDLSSSEEEETSDGNVIDLFDQLKAKRAAANKTTTSTISEVAHVGESEELQFNSEDYRQRLAELGSSEDEETPIGMDKSNTITEANKSKSHRRRANVIDSDSDGNDDENGRPHHPPLSANDANNMDFIDKISKRTESEAGDDDHVLANSTQSSKKRSRLDDSAFDDVNNENDAASGHSEDDAEDVFIARRSLTKERKVLIDGTEQEPAKRRRIAIIDDDDDN